MIKGLPTTSLIVLNTLCPCRHEEWNGKFTCCGNGDEHFTTDKCCGCHICRLNQEQQKLVLHAAPHSKCKWPFHKIIDGHARWQGSTIQLLRECLSATAPFGGQPAVWTREEAERLSAVPAMLRDALGEEEMPDE